MLEILLKDEYGIFRKGISAIIAEALDHASITEVTDIHLMLKKMPEQRWDLIIAATAGYSDNDLFVIKKIRSLYPELPVIVMMPSAHPLYISAVLAAGATACLGRNCSANELKNLLNSTLATAIASTYQH